PRARSRWRRPGPRHRPVHVVPSRAVLLAPARPGHDGPPGRRGVAPLDPDRVRANLAEVRAEVGDGVEILAATKYVPLEQIGVLAEAGVTLAGENRAQDLEAKAAAHPELTSDFIGQLQSRKVKQVLPHVR